METLYKLCKTVPEFTAPIHEGIIDVVRKVLLPKTAGGGGEDYGGQVAVAEPSIGSITIALRMLASFEFIKENSLTAFQLPPPFASLCHEIASDRFLQHESADVRRNAVAAVAALMKPMVPPTYVTPKKAVMYPVLSHTLAGYVEQVLRLVITDSCEISAPLWFI